MIYGSINNNHFSWKTAVKKTLFKTRKLFGFQMILFILYILAIIPIANLGLNSIILEKVHIPDFLITKIEKLRVPFTFITIGIILFLIYISIGFGITLLFNILDPARKKYDINRYFYNDYKSIKINVYIVY